MKYHTSLIILALLTSSFAGCSKHSGEISSPNSKAVDLGIVEVSNGIPICHDLGGGKACVINPTTLKDGSVKLSFVIQETNSSGVVKTLATSSVQNTPGSPMHVYFGGIAIHVTPNIKP